MADEVWTVKRMLDWTCGYLERKGDERPRLSAEWLLSSVTGLSRVGIYTNFDRPLSSDELALMHDAVIRRGRGEPLQYVSGEMPFRHIVLRCEEGVLIPRPETEVLVDAALEGVDASVRAGHAARVLEVGCGTGCIACSVASERPGTHVVATDVSPAAVSLASRNREALGLVGEVDVIECDLADGVDERLMGSFDVLVSNPPYIPSDVVPTLPGEVRCFEPHLALDGGSDGLDVFRRLLELAPRALRPGGMLAVELFETNVGTAAELCRNQGGWVSVEVREDLTHRPRVLVAVREGSLVNPLSEVRELELARMEKVVTVDQDDPAEDVVRRAARALERGGVIVVPTDSVYGIGCAATPANPGHARTFQIKERDRRQTLPWLIADHQDLARFGANVPVWAYRLAEQCWPGALTLVVRASEAVPVEYVLPDAGTIALRLPDSNLVRALARSVGCPLAITSANVHGEAAATEGSGVDSRLVLLADLVLDGGPAPLAVSSTIVDCTGEEPVILREGAISADEIRALARGE
ncbi:MAG: peptide chain release factor N(5)-glutamine methyltransferase [Olsenella sp.]|nr:peptide chain release factor N(5)-glutamine methyltransferase [Olsenella sp.]